jgi:putative heme-binding domain-containing protein
LDGRLPDVLRRIKSEQIEQARRTAADQQQTVKQRLDAVQTLSLAELSSIREDVAELIRPRQPVEIQRAALLLLGRAKVDESPRIVFDAWNELTPGARETALDVLLSRPQWINLVLDRIEAGSFSPRDLGISRLQMLAALPDAEVQRRVDRITQAASTAGDRAGIVTAWQDVLELAGDAGRGQQVFRKTCAGCHRVDQFGYELGPNLAAVRNRGAETILVNVLDPNREMENKYVDYVVYTVDGRIYTGMITAESATSVTLHRAEGKRETLLRSRIETVRNTGKSLMPEGFEQQLDKQSLCDIITYLMSLN